MENVSPLPQSGPDHSETRLWNTLVHAISLTGLMTGVGFILGPLIVWMIQRERFPSVDQHGKESINLNLSMLIYQVGLVVGGFVGMPQSGVRGVSLAEDMGGGRGSGSGSGSDSNRAPARHV